MKRFALPAFLLAPALASAAILNFSWENATRNTDGSAIPASGPGALTGTQIEYGPCNAGRTALASVTATIDAPAGAAAAASPNLPPGDWCSRARHSNTYGEFSTWTGVVFKSVPRPVPEPPSNFSFGS